MKLFLSILFLLATLHPAYAHSGDKVVFVVNEDYLEKNTISYQIIQDVILNVEDETYEFFIFEKEKLHTIKNRRKIFIGINPELVDESFRSDNDLFFAIPYLNENKGKAYSTRVAESILYLSKSVDIKRIDIVYSSKSSAIFEEIKKISVDIRTYGYEVSTKRESITAYGKIFSAPPEEGHLIILPIDDTAFNPDLMLPIIIKRSWQKSIMVYSLNPSLVQKGLLMSAVPDIKETVISIRNAAFKNIKPEDRYSEAKTYIFNRRVLGHLKINIQENTEMVKIL